MYINSTDIRVRYAETDQMGIVHHSNYYVWFELARDEFVESVGLTYKNLEDSGFFMPLVETNCKYISPALYSDRLRIDTHIKELSAVKIVFGYEVFKGDARRPLAKGLTVQAFVDKDFHIINLKKQNPDLFEKLNALVDGNKKR